MCGRCRCTIRPDDIPRACHLNGGASVRQVDIDRYRPAYNVAPGSYMPVIRREDGTNGTDFALHTMKWGLIPSFTKKDEKPDHFRMFNARSESIHEKASFRRLVPKNRCLVTVEGFYEWKKDGSKKQPYYIHFKDDRPLVFAALYDSWKNPEGETLYTFTILTTSSSTHLRWLHDRMPVILGDAASTDLWLNGSASTKFDSLLKPFEAPDLAWYPVTPAMGKISFDGPECIKEISPKAEEKPISKFFFKAGATNSGDLKNPVKCALEEPASQIIVKKHEPKVESKSEPSASPPGSVLTESRSGVKTEPRDQFPLDADEKKHGVKREIEDTKLLSQVEAQKKLTTSSPINKKSKSNANSTAGGNNQATLHSFFKKS